MFFGVWHWNQAFIMSSQWKQNSWISVFWIYIDTNQTKHARSIPKTSYSAVLFTLKRHQESMISISYIKKHSLYVWKFCKNAFFGSHLLIICIIYAYIYPLFIKILNIITVYMMHIINRCEPKNEFLQNFQTYKLCFLMYDVEIIRFWYLLKRNRTAR